MKQFSMAGAWSAIYYFPLVLGFYSLKGNGGLSSSSSLSSGVEECHDVSHFPTLLGQYCPGTFQWVLVQWKQVFWAFVLWKISAPLLRVRAKMATTKPLAQSTLSVCAETVSRTNSLLFLYVPLKTASSHSAHHSDFLKGCPRGLGVPAFFSSKTLNSCWREHTPTAPGSSLKDALKSFPCCYHAASFCPVSGEGHFCGPVLYHFPAASLRNLPPPYAIFPYLPADSHSTLPTC